MDFILFKTYQLSVINEINKNINKDSKSILHLSSWKKWEVFIMYSADCFLQCILSKVNRNPFCMKHNFLSSIVFI